MLVSSPIGYGSGSPRIPITVAMPKPPSLEPGTWVHDGSLVYRIEAVRFDLHLIRPGGPPPHSPTVDVRVGESTVKAILSTHYELTHGCGTYNSPGEIERYNRSPYVVACDCPEPDFRHQIPTLGAEGRKIFDFVRDAGIWLEFWAMVEKSGWHRAIRHYGKSMRASEAMRALGKSL